MNACARSRAQSPVIPRLPAMQDRPLSAVETVLHAIRDAIAAATLERRVAAPIRIAVALSGGRDSMVLLDALAVLAPEIGISLSAVHVDHGLSENAQTWAEFCAAESGKRGVAFSVHPVQVVRAGGRSLEATARAARYAALAAVDADIIALAHHGDDQAETLLLQLLRGAGPQGLAAMPQYRRPPGGPALLRPLLRLPRTAIDAYASARSLNWVDDESNANTGMKRNFVRHEIATRLATAFPAYRATLARAARHQADAASLIDELAALDAVDAVDAMGHEGAAGATLDRAALIALAERAPHRARNLLRWFLRRRGLAAPSAARLAAMLDQLTLAATDARVRIVHDGAEVGFHRGRIIVHAPATAAFALAWHGETQLALPHGTLEFVSCVGAGIAHAALHAAGVVVRARAGGERIRLAADRPTQTLKRLLQHAGMPLWQRESLPLVFCGSSLAAVPGIGVDVAFQARSDAPGYALDWRPRASTQ